MYLTEGNKQVAQKVMDNDKKMILHEYKKENARMSNAKAPPNDDYNAVIKNNTQGGGLSAGVKKYRKKQEPLFVDSPAPFDLMPASNISKGTADRRLGKGQSGGAKMEHDSYEGGREDFTCTCKVKKKKLSIPRARKLIPVNDMPASTYGGSSMPGKTARSHLIKKIMADKGLSMIEASSYIKKNNLY